MLTISFGESSLMPYNGVVVDDPFVELSRLVITDIVVEFISPPFYLCHTHTHTIYFSLLEENVNVLRL